MINIELPDYGNHLRETNGIQKMVIERKISKEVLNADTFGEWTRLYADRFHQLVENRAIADSQFWEKIKDPVEKEKITDEIARELYPKDDLQMAA